MKIISLPIAILVVVHFIGCKESTNAPSVSDQWEQTSLDTTSVRCFAAVGTNLFAGGGGGVFRSTNNGSSWQHFSSGLTYTSLSTGQTVTASVWSLVTLSDGMGGTALVAGTWGGGVYLSTNIGTSWNQVNVGLTSVSNWLDIRSLAVCPNEGGSDLLAGTSADGIFRSTNYGSSWTPVSEGLTIPSVFSLLVHGNDIFAGTQSGGVFVSTNRGTTWVQTSLNQWNVISFALLGTNLFVGTYGGGVHLTTDNGASWTPANSGLTNVQVFCLVSVGTNLFAGTESEGIFLSTNTGAHWTQFNSGMIPLQEATGTTRIYSLFANGPYMFAGSWRGGVWRRPL